MKKIYVLFVVPLFLFACASKNTETLSFFNGLEFKIEQGEMAVSVDELIKEEYANLQKEASVQIPLYRCLKSNEYKIFIGIPYDTSFEELTNFQLAATTLLQEEKGTDYVYKKYKKGDYYISEYIYRKGKNTLVVFGVSYSKENIAFLSKANLSNRLKQTQNEK